MIGRIRLPASMPRLAGVWWATAFLFVLGFVLEPATLSAGHLLNILQVAALLGVVAIGQTIVLLTGGLDLSVAGVITLVNILAAAIMLGSTDRILLGTVVCLGIGTAIGVANGLIVTKARITPLIATLAMNAVLFGSALLYTGGTPSGGIPPAFNVIGQGRVGGIPVAALIWLGLAVVVTLVTRRTTYGRRLFAVGANGRAAHLSGVRVDRVLISAYAASGFLAAVAGLIITAFVGLPSLGIGDKYMLASVAAVVVGGTALTGGIGGIPGTVAGTLFMTQIGSMSNVLRVGTGAQFFIQGAVIVAGTALYRLHRRGRARDRTLTLSEPAAAP